MALSLASSTKCIFKQHSPGQSSARQTRTVQCSAHNQDRRQALKLLTGIPLLLASPALAEREIGDARGAAGSLRSMDQARDTDVNQKQRFSMTDDNMTPELHKKRIRESLSRLEKNVAADISKKHWPRVSSDLRGQMSTLRFDLDALNASVSDKSKRKAAQKQQNAAMKALEQLDYLARTNNADNNILDAFQYAFSQLNQVVSSLG